ncbi:30S ribosomal protein S16 [Candidatus Berkelbacteria bacterium]|nr:30S ribosomal protein S16 [Candidatus Berkelbacteria bacterium]
MLRIRLRRTGKKHQPHYRVVVAEHSAPVRGKFVSELGHYNPRTKEIVLKLEDVTAWLDKGAQPSQTIARLLTKQGLTHKQISVHTFPERPGKKAPSESVNENATVEPAAATEPAQPEAETKEADASESSEPAKEEAAAQSPSTEEASAA